MYYPDFLIKLSPTNPEGDPDLVNFFQNCKLEWQLTITTIGLVLILLARAAYRRVFDVSDKLDRAGDTQAIWKEN